MYSDDINPENGTTGLMAWAGWGGATATRCGVMRWTSGVSGRVDVAGMWTPYWAASYGGTGMDVAVYADGAQMFIAILMPTDSAGLDFGIDAVPGSVVDYVVGPGSSNDGNEDKPFVLEVASGLCCTTARRQFKDIQRSNDRLLAQGAYHEQEQSSTPSRRDEVHAGTIPR
jgi:hypothetical protein